MEVISKPEFQPGQRGDLKDVFSKSIEDFRRLNQAWFSRLDEKDSFVQEKISLFWHDHLACRARSPYLAQEYYNTLRSQALSPFSELLLDISKDPAMLLYLNNQQNRKDQPNENFARELMELFTIGRGKYSEEDVKEAARAFTGWSFNPLNGEFLFRVRQHDYGQKVFFGKKGNWDGTDIMEIILDNPETAENLVRKIWKSFISESFFDEEKIHELTTLYYRSGYDTQKLFEEMISQDFFYSSSLAGDRIKSPIELLKGIEVHTGGEFSPESSFFLQRSLGQTLFFPPNVGGWPKGKEWIDSASLVFRLNLPQAILLSMESPVSPKDDGDINNPLNRMNQAKLELKVDWEKVAQAYWVGNAESSLEQMEFRLLARPTSSTNRRLVSQRAANASDEVLWVKNAMIGMMSLPEYQLC